MTIEDLVRDIVREELKRALGKEEQVKELPATSPPVDRSNDRRVVNSTAELIKAIEELCGGKVDLAKQAKELLIIEGYQRFSLVSDCEAQHVYDLISEGLSA